MNRRHFLKGAAAVLASLPFVRGKAASAGPVREFTDQEPYGFVPPSVTCWPGRGKKAKSFSQGDE